MAQPRHRRACRVISRGARRGAARQRSASASRRAVARNHEKSTSK